MLTYGNVIKTNLSNDSWLNFWGSYSSGIFAVVYSNRNSEKVIMQQDKLLIHQQNIKKLDEYNDCLKNNLALLNIVMLWELQLVLTIRIYHYLNQKYVK